MTTIHTTTAYLDEYGDMEGAYECPRCKSVVYRKDDTEECDECADLVCSRCATRHRSVRGADWFLCPKCEERR